MLSCLFKVEVVLRLAFVYLEGRGARTFSAFGDESKCIVAILGMQCETRTNTAPFTPRDYHSMSKIVGFTLMNRGFNADSRTIALLGGRPRHLSPVWP